MISKTILFCALALLPSAPQGVPPDQVPSKIHGFEGKSPARLSLTGSTVKGTASYQLADKTVQFLWEWEAAGPRPIQHSTQVEAVPFYPTEICQVGPGRVAVAGKRRSKTIIELWEFGSPVIPPAIISNTQQYIYPEINVPVASKTVLYEEAMVGRDIVSVMLNNPAPPASATASLFVQFFDSKDLYSLTYTAGGSSTDPGVASCVCVRKSQPDPAIPAIPALSTHFETRWSAKHSAYGYVYVFVHPEVPALVLYDSNLDGILDSPGCLQLDDAAWESGNWGDLTTYLAAY